MNKINCFCEEYWNKTKTFKTILTNERDIWYVKTFDYSEGIGNSQCTYYKYFDKKKDALLAYKVQKQWVDI